MTTCGNDQRCVVVSQCSKIHFNISSTRKRSENKFRYLAAAAVWGAAVGSSCPGNRPLHFGDEFLMNQQVLIQGNRAQRHDRIDPGRSQFPPTWVRAQLFGCSCFFSGLFCVIHGSLSHFVSNGFFAYLKPEQESRRSYIGIAIHMISYDGFKRLGLPADDQWIALTRTVIFHN